MGESLLVDATKEENLWFRGRGHILRDFDTAEKGSRRTRKDCGRGIARLELDDAKYFIHFAGIDYD